MRLLARLRDGNLYRLVLLPPSNAYATSSASPTKKGTIKGQNGMSIFTRRSAKLSNYYSTQVDIAIPEPEPSFRIDGKVVEVYQGCGIAVLDTNSSDSLTINRGTDGIHFEELSVGDRVNCQVAIIGSRVLYGHQQTQSMASSVKKSVCSVRDVNARPAKGLPRRSAGAFDSEPRSMTKVEFITEYCRRWGVAWGDISKYRAALPTDEGVGWKMVNIGIREDDETLHGPLEPLSE